MYFDLKLKSASSGTKSLPLQARNRKNFLKHMPTNKTHESVINATINNSDEPGQMHSLTRAFAARTHIGSNVVSECT